VQFPTVTPIAPTRVREPFDHADWIFELKLDGFGALANVEDGQCRLVSRRGHVYKAFGQLATAIGQTLEGHSAVLDGEIVCLNDRGEPQFADLLYRRDEPWFYAFDLLWLDGQDLRDLPLVERKRRLRALVPSQGSRLLYLDHVVGRGTDLFRAVCERDLEGIVAKHAESPYRELPRSWVKVINTHCSQLRDLHDLFERRAVLRATLTTRTSAPEMRPPEPPEAAQTGESERRRPARATLKAGRSGRRPARKKAR
jgi:bifunctional non-homologous end joining protein LigD